MARSLRHHKVSYKEDSTASESDLTPSEDDQPLAPSPSSRSASRHHRARPRVVYTEPGSDVEAISADEHEFKTSPVKRRRLDRHAHADSINTRSQRSAPLSQSNQLTSFTHQHQRRSSRNAKSSPTKPVKTHAKSIRQKSTRQVGSARPARRPFKPSYIPETILSDGTIPRWSSLPFEVLKSIFKYASTPLRDPSTLQHTPTVSWLLNTSRVCKAFFDPAMTAFYDSPPLSGLGEPHLLLDLLSLPEDATSISYRTKVKSLEFQARNTLVYAAHGRGPFDLPRLLQYTPLLSSIDIMNETDKPPFRHKTPNTQYIYPNELFTALESNRIQLKSWRWNGSMFKSEALQDMRRLHQTEPFKSLTHLTVSHVDISIRRTGAKGSQRQLDTKHPETPHAILAETLTQLPNLKSLSLESLNAGDIDDFGQWDWISLLPETLEKLSIINAPYLNSDTITSFLETHGAYLKELTLSHNQLLDLDFLAALKNSCPKLESLTMDCQYYSAHELARDSEPLYDTLLDEDTIPTWPSKLRTIELIHLRKWESDAAITFFTSLIDAANDLPDLRHINIKAMLNIGWRDRAGFRDTWINRMQSIFLDQSPDPDPHLASFKAYREWLNAAPTRSHTQDSRSRIEKSTRSRAERDEFLEGKHIQGRCSVVDVNVDNLRPTEHQYTERDFMDSEQSGDEEWRGDSGDEPTRYAW